MGPGRVVRSGGLLVSLVLVAGSFVASTAGAASRTRGAHVASGPVAAAACWERNYTDTLADAVPDALSYSLKFDCPSRFTLTVSRNRSSG